MVKILPWKQNFMVYTGEKLFKSNSRASLSTFFPFGIYLFKVNNGNTRTLYEIYSKLTIASNINYMFFVSLLLTLINLTKISLNVLVNF